MLEAEHNAEHMYIPGCENTLVDCLSRWKQALTVALDLHPVPVNPQLFSVNLT